VSELTIREHKAAERLLKAAYDFWEERKKHGANGAVIWLKDDSGKVVIFTRGEYTNTLMSNIHQIHEPKEFHHISEEVSCE
jgi:hypothetical protein